MASPPASTKTSLGQKLRARARERWPQLTSIDVRFRGKFAYVTGHLPGGQDLPLCRLRYAGYASTWGFAIYRASHEDYQDSYLPSGQPWLDRTGELKRLLTTVSDAPDRRTLTLDLSHVDPAIALMLETRIGAVDPVGREGRNVIELPVLDEDIPDLIRLAITGIVRPRTWDLQARYVEAVDKINASDPDLTIEQFLAESPFARCGQATIKAQTTFPPPVVCVVGETADDHALALLCDRLFHHAAWIPTHLVLEDGPLRSAVRTALYELRDLPGATDRPTLVTSLSEPSSVVDSLAVDLKTMFGAYPQDEQTRRDIRAFRSITPVSLANHGGRSILADPAAFAVRRRLPVADDARDVSVLAPLALPSPQAVEHLGPDRQPRQQVDNSYVICLDDFARPSVPGWDQDRFRRQVLDPLLAGHDAGYQRSDWPTDAGAEWHRVPAGSMVIINGVSSTRTELGDCWDLTVWVETPRSVRLARGVKRDGEAVRSRWTEV